MPNRIEMNRRDFLKNLPFLGAVAKELLAGNLSVGNLPDKVLTAPEQPDDRLKILHELNQRFSLESLPTGLYEYLQNHLNLVLPLKSIVNFRDAIALHELPFALYSYYPQNADNNWQSDQQENISSNLPESQKSYATVGKEVFQAIFGKKAGVMVKEINTSGPDGGISFVGSDRKIFVPTWFEEEIDGFIGIMLHEGAGHGTDANGMSYLPPEAFFPMLEGYYQLISQCWSIPGELLNHPSDFMGPIITYDLGMQIVKEKLEGSLDLYDLEYKIPLQRIFEQTTQELAEGHQNTWYGRKFCYLLGEHMIKAIQKGELDGYPAVLFEGLFEEKMIEIYAEGVRLLLEPREVFGVKDKTVDNGLQAAQGNFNMSTGYTEVLETIRGEKVDLVKIRADLAQIYFAAQNLPLPSAEKAAIEVDPEQERIKEFRKKLYEGQVPNLPELRDYEDLKKLLQRWANIAHLFVTQYPGLLELTHNPKWDMEAADVKNLFAWETDEVQDLLGPDEIDWAVTLILLDSADGIQEVLLEKVERLEALATKAELIGSF
jgi:hypothetical protein